MAMAQGWLGALWVSLGFFIALFVTARIAYPILLGLPRAIRLVSSGEMRAAVYRRLLFTPVLWIVALAVIVLLVGFFWPAAAAWFEENGALNGGVWLGVAGTLLSALSQKSRADFNADFDQSYRKFYVHRDAHRRRSNRHRRSVVSS
ncbi:MAG: hypothetical protein DME90_09420 [Verrucomicrobia bacterium]|nr:MAG: hypothetical protein DME90_09420 [Verrucomicrobiota bacterium]